MNRKIYLTIGGVVLVIIIAVIAFLLFGKPQKTEEQSTTTQESGEESFTGSILSLLGTGRNTECSFSRSDENGTTNGHVYLSGDKMYGEFMTSADGQDFDAYVINDGEYSYTWSSASEQGTKLKISDVEATESAEDRNEASQTLEEDVDLKCKGWSVDNSKFVPPADVEFVDLTSQLEQTQQNIPQLENREAICDPLTGDAKQQCLDSLNQ